MHQITKALLASLPELPNKSLEDVKASIAFVTAILNLSGERMVYKQLHWQGIEDEQIAQYIKLSRDLRKLEANANKN